jgi:predicted aldo/keto reductase-like oxidoreductase
VKFKEQGKTKYLGIATHSYEPEAIRAAADTGVFDVVMTAYNFKKSNRTEIEDAINYAAGKGMGIIAMKTMAGAYWDKERTRPINTRAALKFPFIL